MSIVKSRKQGNAVMVTLPKYLQIEEGVAFEPIKVEEGILYKYVLDEELDFDREILKNIISEGFEGQDILTEFDKRKNYLPQAFNRLAAEARSNPKLSQEELEAELGL